MCDASAAVALGRDLFIAGDDESNALSVYTTRHPGPPLSTRDVSVFLGLRRGAEVDIEGSARLGDHVFWISSHGTNVRGKKRLARQRFFATTGAIAPHGGGIDLRPVGRPYLNLLKDLLREPKLAPFHLAAAANLPPKTPGALSIEGLTATPDQHLLIGFRNPIPGGRALLVPLRNPVALIQGRESARFGNAVLLPLNGLGIRSIELWRDHYLIVGGTADGKGDSSLYLWDGASAQPQRLVDVSFRDINPEAIAIIESGAPNQVELLVVSDDGTVQVDGAECKRSKDSSRKQFRSLILPLTRPVP